MVQVAPQAGIEPASLSINSRALCRLATEDYLVERRETRLPGNGNRSPAFHVKSVS